MIILIKDTADSSVLLTGKAGEIHFDLMRSRTPTVLAKGDYPFRLGFYTPRQAGKPIQHVFKQAGSITMTNGLSGFFHYSIAKGYNPFGDGIVPEQWNAFFYTLRYMMKAEKANRFTYRVVN